MGVDEIVGRAIEDGADLIRGEQGNIGYDPYDGFGIFRNLLTSYSGHHGIIDRIVKGNLHKAPDSDVFREFVPRVVGESSVIYGPAERYNFYKHFWSM